MPTRRTFLKTTTALAGSFILPSSLFATPSDPGFYFIHADTGHSWPITDPVRWSLENQHEPILERASIGLAKLTENDGDRIIRLVVRRCSLNLIEIHHEKVIVHHWGQHQANLKPFFKQHGLACPEVTVELRERKKETSTTKPGDSYLFGSQITADFPLDLFQTKFANRFTKQADDWQAAPNTNCGFAWANLEDNRIPWAALKSAWRRAAPGVCLNCDGKTLLVNFGLPWTGMLSRSPRFESVCGTCRRSFRDEAVDDVGQWIVANLDAEVRPGYEMVWGRRVRRVTV